ncbi:unnamed protein product [Oikopleura dioica]|uniref:Condensation domain-containing protein n=1 Tax=Oikopleura dioica TaxID=34765 RepID=E4YDK6_OIKDI|nr:unnamed protein product [Oikopleura dioica]
MREENEIETIMNNDRVTVSFAALIDFKENLDKSLLNSAWFRTRQLNSFLRGRWEKTIFKKFDYTDCAKLSQPEYRKSDCCHFKKQFDKITQEYTFEKLNQLPVPSHLVVFGSEKRVQFTILAIHSLVDGKSMHNILNDLLFFYKNSQLNIFTGIDAIDSKIEDVPKPLTELRPCFPEFSDKQKKYKAEFHKRLLNFKNVVPHQKFDGIEHGRPQNLKSTTTLGSGSKQGSKRLKLFCKENGITIGTLLIAATAFLNAKIMKSIEISKHLNIDVIYNLRPHLTEINSSVACYIFSTGFCPAVLSHQTLLDIAKEMKDESNAKLDNLEHFMFPQLIKQFEQHGGEYKIILDQNNGVCKYKSVSTCFTKFKQIRSASQMSANSTLTSLTCLMEYQLMKFSALEHAGIM